MKEDPFSEISSIIDEYLFSNPKEGNPILHDVFKMRLQMTQCTLDELPRFIQLGDHAKSFVVEFISNAKESLRFCAKVLAKFEQDNFLSSDIIGVYHNEVEEAKKRLAQYGMVRR